MDVDMDDLERQLRDNPPGAPRLVDTTAQMLEIRKATHGDVRLTAKVATEIQEAAFWGPSELSHEQRYAITMIAVKLARITCGDPKNRDAWLDIAGYARLVADAL